MAEQLSLADLKAENKALEQNEQTPPVEDEFIEDVADDQNDDDQNDDDKDIEDDVDDDSKDDDKNEELEDWQKSDEDEDDSEDGKKKTGFVPNAAAAKLRHKLKNAKAEGKTREAELEAEIERLKVSSTPAKTEVALPPRPLLENYEFDRERHEQALDDWYDKRTDAKINSHTDNLQQQRLQEAQNQKAIQLTTDAITGHVERAATLIADGKIKEDLWVRGDVKIREALNLATSGKGEAFADQFITLLNENGPGSEKVWYYLGQNQRQRDEFVAKVAKDPSGATAIMFLAGIQSKASQSIRKKRSAAPKPSAELVGDVPNRSASKAEKQYAKSSDPQVRISLKRAARKKGIDVSTW